MWKNVLDFCCVHTTQLANSTCFHAPISHYGHTHNVAAAQTCRVCVWFVCQPIHCALLFWAVCAMCSKNLQPTTKISSALLCFVLHPPTDCKFFLIFSLQIFLLWKKQIICSDIKGERWENFGLLQLYVFCSPINKNEAHNEKQKKIIAAKRNPTQEQEDSQKCIIKLQQQWKRNEAKYRLSDERVVNLRWVLIADIHR